MRKSIPASLRWSIFARDGFTCRYCGKQAGQDGVELVIDHLVSVKENGDNSFSNLVTSCQSCNSGKGARSLSEIPTSEEVIERIRKMASRLEKQVEAIQLTIQCSRELEQEVVNLKCAAYDKEFVNFARGEIKRVQSLIEKHGPELIFECYQIAATNRVKEFEAIRYIQGIIRNRIAAGELS